MSTPPQQPQWPQQPYPGMPQQPPPQRNTGRTVRTIIVLVCVIAVAVIAVVAVMKNKSDSDGKAAPNPNADGRTVQRKGFQSGLDADPAPLSEGPPGAAVTYRGQRVVQACNLLTVADIRRIGLLIEPDSLPNTVNFERSYIAPDGTAPLSTSSLGFETADGGAINHCNFAFHGKGKENDTLGIAVSQTAYVPGANQSMTIAAEDYVRKANIGNVQVYSYRRQADHPGDAVGDAVLRLGGVTVNVSFNLEAGGPAEKLNAVATTIGHNLTAQVARPQGIRPIEYRSPVFTKSAVSACRLLTPAAFTAAFHTPASQLVTERPATAVGTTTFPNDPQGYNNVYTSCDRGTGQDDPLSRTALELQVTSYQSPAAARKDIASQKQLDGGVPTAARLGDESIVELKAPSPQFTGAMSIRKGRFVLSLHQEDPSHHPKGLSQAEANAILTPAARLILQRLGNQP
ncbi:MAG TPA: hypothetical protein VHC49_06020 [Mycobacteriales bacterium]|nr:hypothetical protein [Mycobacteriales bacterium]